MITLSNMQLDNTSHARIARHDGLLARCSATIQRLHPGLHSVEHIEQDSLRIEVSQEHGAPLNREQLLRLGRTLALQLGLEIQISNYRAPSQLHVSNHDTFQGQQGSQPHDGIDGPIIVAPTVYVVPYHEPFSNIYDTVPPDIISRIHVKNLLAAIDDQSNPSRGPAIVGIKAALNKFSVSMHEAKLHTFGGFLHVLIDADPDIIEEEAFYELSQELVRAANGQSLVVTVAPRRQQADEALPVEDTNTHDELLQESLPTQVDLATETIDLKHSPEIAAFCERLLTEIGTSLPYTVRFISSTDKYVVNLLYKRSTASHFQSISDRISHLITESKLPISVTYSHASRNALILNEGRRPTISKSEMLHLAALIRTNLHISDESEWAHVAPCEASHSLFGNCIEISPKIRVTAPLFESIKAAATHIPAPILLHRPHTTREYVTPSEVKAIIKMILPPTASLGTVRTSQSGVTRVNIHASRSSWPTIHGALSTAFESLDPDLQEVIFHHQKRHEKICDAIAKRSDLYRKHFISNMDENGDIPIREWKPPPIKQVRLTECSFQSLRKRYPSMVDRTDVPVSLWDVEGTARAEDGQSLVINGGILTHGIHFANAAIQMEQFSLERHHAYMRGDSVYVHNDTDLMIAHMLPGIARHTFQKGVVSPALSVFIDYPLDAFGDPAAIAESIENARIEATFVKPSSRNFYPRGVALDWQKSLPKAARRELAMMSKIGAALTRYSAGFDLPAHEDSIDDPRKRMGSINGIANYILAKRLAESNLPCLYHVTVPLTPEAIQSSMNALKFFAAEYSSIAALYQHTPEEVAADSRLLHQLFVATRLLPRITSLGSSFPHITEAISAAPGPHVIAGYNPYIGVNTGFRKLVSLVAQHQLNASLGLVTPLSRGEVQSIYNRQINQAAAGHQERITEDLRLIGNLKHLQRVSSNPLWVRARNKPRSHTVEIDVDLPFSCRCRCIASLSPEEAKEINAGDMFRVEPVHYSLTNNTLFFERTRQ